MVVTQKETSTFSSSVSDESSVLSCTFSGKETTRCNSFKVLLNGLVWLGEQIGKFFKFIFERCCSCCATKRNVLISDAARNSGEKGAIPEPAVSGRQSEWANQEAHESQLFSSSAEAMTPSGGATAEPAASDRTEVPQTSVLPVFPSTVIQNRKSKGLNEKSDHLSLSLESAITTVAPGLSVDQADSLLEAGLSERSHHVDDSMLSFLQESVDSINACENGYEEIADPYHRTDDLEACLLQWSRELSLDSPEEKWQCFRETVSEQCHLLLIGLESKEKIPANWPSVVFKEHGNVILPYQYYARIQQILRIFPACGNEMAGKCMDVNRHDNDFKFEREFREHLDAIGQELNLCQGYIDAFSDNTNPVSFTINAQGSRELELTAKDVEELQRKITGGIIEQVLQTEKEAVLDSSTNLPVLFVEKDLPRNDYYVINDDGQILALTKPGMHAPEEGESSKESREKYDAELNELNKKKNADVITHIKRLSPDPLVQRKVCYFLTQDPLLGFLHGIESGLIEPLFGAGFSVSGSEGFRTTFGKDTESNKIKIQYEFEYKNTEIRNLNMTTPEGYGVLMMHDVNKRWKKSLIKCTISVVIDPENPDDVTTEGLVMHIAFPVD